MLLNTTRLIQGFWCPGTWGMLPLFDRMYCLHCYGSRGHPHLQTHTHATLTSTCMPTLTHRHKRAYVCAPTCMHICTQTHIQTYPQMHTHSHACTHTNTVMCNASFLLLMSCFCPAWYGVEWQGSKWIQNWKGCGRKCSCKIPVFPKKNWWKSTGKSSNRTVGCVDWDLKRAPPRYASPSVSVV